MNVRAASPNDLGRVWALIERSLRPDGGPTRARDDFPVALAPENAEGLIVLEDGGEVRACLSSLARPLVTSLGELAVAGIGSVATEPAWRGLGLSRRLQEESLRRLGADGVALAVLWTDRPALYAGRGFRPAGVEHHVALGRWRPSVATVRRGRAARPYAPGDCAAVERLYQRHSYRTVRRAGEAARLYAMPGTRGLVLERSGEPSAYVFCGKGLDFPGYVLEWGGDLPEVQALLARARGELGATHVLAPQGAEALVAALTARGALSRAHPVGLWAVLRPDLLAAAAGADATAGGDAGVWLGGIDEAGRIRSGPCRLAVWGFDSV